jgi:myosin heavy subunit
MALFKEENMDCALDACPDNQPCVDLLSGKGGILACLNDQCAQMKPSEDKFVRDAQDAHKKNAFFPKASLVVVVFLVWWWSFSHRRRVFFSHA